MLLCSKFFIILRSVLIISISVSSIILFTADTRKTEASRREGEAKDLGADANGNGAKLKKKKIVPGKRDYEPTTFPCPGN